MKKSNLDKYKKYQLRAEEEKDQEPWGLWMLGMLLACVAFVSLGFGLGAQINWNWICK